jgi:hypothetical protein
MKLKRRGSGRNDPIPIPPVIQLLRRPLTAAIETSRGLHPRKPTRGGVIYQDFRPDTGMDPVLR